MKYLTKYDLLISIKNISKIYTTSTIKNFYALENISFDIYQGEIISLLGLNGAGKTTLSNIIATLKKPTSGDIIWNNQSIYSNLEKYRMNIGYCPQQIPMNQHLTIYEALFLSGTLYGLTKKESLQKTDELIDLFELTPHINKEIYKLSGGLKQRVGIARSLLHNPSLIILDEPTIALDCNIRNQLWSLLLELKNKGITIVLTTHYLEESEYLSDRIILLHNGLIEKITTSKDLILEYKTDNLDNAFNKFIEEKKIKL